MSVDAVSLKYSHEITIKLLLSHASYKERRQMCLRLTSAGNVLTIYGRRVSRKSKTIVNLIVTEPPMDDFGTHSIF